MTVDEFSKELWERMARRWAGVWSLAKQEEEAHTWAVEQYRKLVRWNEELRDGKFTCMHCGAMYHSLERASLDGEILSHAQLEHRLEQMIKHRDEWREAALSEDRSTPFPEIYLDWEGE